MFDNWKRIEFPILKPISAILENERYKTCLEKFRRINIVLICFVPKINNTDKYYCITDKFEYCLVLKFDFTELKQRVF